MTRVRAAVFYLVLFGVAFGVYHSNGPYPLGSFDSAPNSLLAFDLLSRGALDFDDLRGGRLVRSGAGYAFVEAPNGHYASIFPIGTAIVTLPLYVAFDTARRVAGRPVDIAAPAFEPVRELDEKAAATVVAALAVVLFYVCARGIASGFAAGIATLAFGFGTEVWTIGSQALWQHGSVCLVLLATIAALQRALRAPSGRRRAAWVLGAGLCAGLLVTVRPTALLFALAAFAFVAWRNRSGTALFGLGFAAGVLPAVAWNAYFFHSLLGGYGPNLATVMTNVASIAGAFAGELVSPNRGLFVFTPLALFSIGGAIRATRAKTDDARLMLLLAGACVALCALCACFTSWWGGWCYGPRYLTDAMPVAALLLLYVIPASPRAFLRHGAGAWIGGFAFFLALTASIAVQIVGANSGTEGGRWNAVPRSIDSDPARIWDGTDLQIAWNARAMWRALFVTPAAVPRQARDDTGTRGGTGLPFGLRT